MTYTFKLARRLAVSRNFIMLPALLVIAACSSDATAPEGPTEIPSGSEEWRSRDIIPVTVQVHPSTVTIETNQLINFRAHGLNRAGDSVAAAVTWSTSGGTILPDGRFSAAAIGTYTVVGLNRVRGTLQQDTSLVYVVRRQTQLAGVEVSPASVTLAPGVSQTFTAVGRLVGGSVVPIGVNWAAGGGSIDAGGTFVAGDTAGTYRITATNTAGTLADTVTVTITAPPAPPPPPAPTPTPGVAKVILMPATATLATSTGRQFSAFGRTGDGDSVAVSVTFTATGGTITQNGLYTAGSTGGTFRVIATTGTLADTSTVTVTKPLGSGTPTGIPFGPFGSWSGVSLLPNTEVFSLSHTSFLSTNILDRLAVARTKRVKQLPSMTGGARANYLTDGVFDMAKWKAKMDGYNTPAIRAAVNEAVADGTIIGNSVMDEPFNTGGPGNEENSWGPPGTMNKARVDTLCGYVKSMFPGMPVGVFHDYSKATSSSYEVCDFMVSQYRASKGTVTSYRDAALAVARRDGHAMAFSLNIMDGGYVIPGCPLPETGGPGTYGTLCRMTPDQVREWGIILGSAGCALIMWRYDSAVMANPVYQAAFRDVAEHLAGLPAKACRRS
jgi:hypothetical protein